MARNISCLTRGGLWILVMGSPRVVDITKDYFMLHEMATIFIEDEVKSVSKI